MSKLPPRVLQIFLDNKIMSSDTFEGRVEVGDTIIYIKKGKKPVHKRICSIRKNKNKDVDLDRSVAIALQFGFMTSLLAWLKKEKGWLDGGYDENCM